MCSTTFQNLMWIILILNIVLLVLYFVTLSFNYWTYRQRTKVVSKRIDPNGWYSNSVVDPDF
jgi:hypothetical protein